MSYVQQIGLLVIGSVLGGFFLRSLFSALAQRKPSFAAVDGFMTLASLGAVAIALDALWNHKFLNSITANTQNIVLWVLAGLALLIIVLVTIVIYLMAKPRKRVTKQSEEKPKASKSPNQDLLSEVDKVL